MARSSDRRAAPDSVEPQSGDRQTIARLADDVLPLLIARLGASGLGELEVRQGDWRVRLRRSVNGQAADASPSTTHGHSAVRQSTAPRSSEQATEPAPRRERGRVAVTSPAVGYYQPRDGLAVGASVRGGDVLGYVDVLGVRQQVVAPEDGILAALSAEAGEAVEYGQTLARLEPAGDGRG